MTGEAEFNEVYFTDTRIPDSERLGEPGDGWRVSLTTLMNERVSIGGLDPAEGLGPDRRRLVKSGRTSRRTARTRRRRDEVMKLWIEAEVAAAHQHPGQRRTARWATRGPRARSASSPPPSRTRTSTPSSIDLLGADGMLYGSYEMVRPETAMGVRHAAEGVPAQPGQLDRGRHVPR